MRRRWVWMGAVWLAGAGLAWAVEGPRACFRSVAEAAAATHTLDPENVGPENTGFRLEDLRRDRMLNKRWAMIRSCDHPERPLLTVELQADETAGPVKTQHGSGAMDRQAVAAAYVVPVVRAGARVRLIGNDHNLHFETVGVAQTNGALGQVVTVRLERLASSDGSAARVLTGVVRGTDVLEWEP